MKSYLQRLFDHAFWADHRVLDLLRAWPAGGPDPDIMRLVSHLVAAERVWLLRLRGEDSAAQPIWPDLSLEEVEALTASNQEGYTRYLAQAEEAELEREVDYRTSTGAPFRTRAADILTHVALHGSYHRGQLARAIRLAGQEPVNTDFIMWVREGGPRKMKTLSS